MSSARTPALPWNDPRGRFSPMKALVFGLLLLPGVWMIWTLVAAAPDMPQQPGPGIGLQGLPDRGLLGPGGPAGGIDEAGLSVPQVKETLLLAGLWAVRLLTLSLLVTPLKLSLGRPKIGQLRRMIGVAAGLYTLAHFGLYLVWMKLDVARIASEIWLRTYLTIGFVAVLILAALLATSTDGMAKRLGGRAWKRLHKTVYAAALLGALHFFMQTRLEPGEATILAGILGWAALWRLADARRPGWVRGVPGLVGLALAAGLLTVGIEAAWFAFGTSLDPWRVVAANLMPDVFPRPAAVVAMAGLGIVGLHLAVRPRPRAQPARPRRNSVA